jgi:FPC/CPF motif-containing protein YcgG
MTTNPILLASEQDVLDRAPGWGQAAYRELAATMRSRSPAYPCTFAVAAFKQRHLRYTFVESAVDARCLRNLRDALVQYLGGYRSIARHSSLVTFFRPEPEPLGLDGYRRRFWGVLEFLHEHDPEPWPEHIPPTPDDPRWQFCFGGEDIFIVCNTPALVRRRSRRSSCMTIFFQPMWTFEPLLSSPERMLEASLPIRSRLERYDTIGRHPALGMLGEPDNREWRHYFLPDHNGYRYRSCPLRAASRTASLAPGSGAGRARPG